MKKKLFWILTAILFTILVVLRLFSINPVNVEHYYSNGIYPVLSSFFRWIFGWMPFSLGDILYAVAIVWILFKLCKTIHLLWKRKMTWLLFFDALKKTLVILLTIMIVFNIFWGMNYNRLGIARQLELKIEKYTVNDIAQMNGILLEKVNNAKSALLSQKYAYPSSGQLFEKVKKAYSSLENTYPFLQYHTVSIKPSLWGWLGNYLGFTGYYNPFTGEAQVNTLVPKFLQPFTSCHEVAHQLGYAKEMEANFVGYLAASASTDTLLHYSVYLDLFVYSNRHLYRVDSVAAKRYALQLLPAVKTDLKEWRDFNTHHKNFIEPVFRWLYGKYLQSNQQPQGILSYDEVVGFLVAYYKKFGKI